MHASVASLSSSSSSSEQQQRHEMLQHLQQPVRQRAALPSLASLRMQTPPPFAELASSSSTQQACPSFGASRKSSMSSSSGASSALNSSRASSSNGASNQGFWKNPILYKTTMCDNWTSKKPCKYGARCWYAHGFGELRFVPRLDQLPETVREALFVEPALARAFFQEMTSLDAGYSTAASTGGSSSSSYASRSESRASMASSSSSSLAGSCRLSMSPASTVSDSPPTNELEALLYSPPLAAAPSYHHSSDKRDNRWAPGAAWTEGAETPRASRVAPATVPLAKPLTTSDYRLFDAAHSLAIDLSFLRD